MSLVKLSSEWKNFLFRSLRCPPFNDAFFSLLFMNKSCVKLKLFTLFFPSHSLFIHKKPHVSLFYPSFSFIPDNSQSALFISSSAASSRNTSPDALRNNRASLYQPWNPCIRPVFRDKVGPIIALASYPGSGNTWVRYLIQQASGEHYLL